jgi:hypothetical protein
MLKQRAPEVTASDVERVVRRDFPAERVAEVQALLGEYGTEDWHLAIHRVRLAALKLAAGSVERLRSQIETAKADYRDVLAPAEYPGYSPRAFRLRELTPEEHERIIEADWRQYHEWLGRR